MKWAIPYGGELWEFDDTRMTASEARLQKRITEGMTPTQATRARFELDPDVFVAALVIARRRAGLELDEALAIDDEALDLTAIADATEQVVRKEQNERAAERARASDTEADADTDGEGDEPAPAKTRRKTTTSAASSTAV